MAAIAKETRNIAGITPEGLAVLDVMGAAAWSLEGIRQDLIPVNAGILRRLIACRLPGRWPLGPIDRAVRLIEPEDAVGSASGGARGGVAGASGASAADRNEIEDEDEHVNEDGLGHGLTVAGSSMDVAPTGMSPGGTYWPPPPSGSSSGPKSSSSSSSDPLAAEQGATENTSMGVTWDQEQGEAIEREADAIRAQAAADEAERLLRATLRTVSSEDEAGHTDARSGMDSLESESMASGLTVPFDGRQSPDSMAGPAWREEAEPRVRVTTAGECWAEPLGHVWGLATAECLGISDQPSTRPVASRHASMAEMQSLDFIVRTLSVVLGDGWKLCYSKQQPLHLAGCAVCNEFVGPAWARMVKRGTSMMRGESSSGAQEQSDSTLSSSSSTLSHAEGQSSESGAGELTAGKSAPRASVSTGGMGAPVGTVGMGAAFAGNDVHMKADALRILGTGFVTSTRPLHTARVAADACQAMFRLVGATRYPVGVVVPSPVLREPPLVMQLEAFRGWMRGSVLARSGRTRWQLVGPGQIGHFHQNPGQTPWILRLLPAGDFSQLMASLRSLGGGQH